MKVKSFKKENTKSKHGSFKTTFTHLTEEESLKINGGLGDPDFGNTLSGALGNNGFGGLGSVNNDFTNSLGGPNLGNPSAGNLGYSENTLSEDLNLKSDLLERQNLSISQHKPELSQSSASIKDDPIANILSDPAYKPTIDTLLRRQKRSETSSLKPKPMIETCPIITQPDFSKNNKPTNSPGGGFFPNVPTAPEPIKRQPSTPPPVFFPPNDFQDYMQALAMYQIELKLWEAVQAKLAVELAKLAAAERAAADKWIFDHMMETDPAFRVTMEHANEEKRLAEDRKNNPPPIPAYIISHNNYSSLIFDNGKTFDVSLFANLKKPSALGNKNLDDTSVGSPSEIAEELERRRQLLAIAKQAGVEPTERSYNDLLKKGISYGYELEDRKREFKLENLITLAELGTEYKIFTSASDAKKINLAPLANIEQAFYFYRNNDLLNTPITNSSTYDPFEAERRARIVSAAKQAGIESAHLKVNDDLLKAPQGSPEDIRIETARRKKIVDLINVARLAAEYKLMPAPIQAPSTTPKENNKPVSTPVLPDLAIKDPQKQMPASTGAINGGTIDKPTSGGATNLPGVTKDPIKGPDKTGSGGLVNKGKNDAANGIPTTTPKINDSMTNPPTPLVPMPLVPTPTENKPGLSPDLANNPQKQTLPGKMSMSVALKDTHNFVQKDHTYVFGGLDCSEFVGMFAHKLGLYKDMPSFDTKTMMTKAFKEQHKDKLQFMEGSQETNPKENTFIPQPGDIFVWHNGKHGHTGIVKEYIKEKDQVIIMEVLGPGDENGYRSAEQNALNSNRSSDASVISTYTRTGGALVKHAGWGGYFRPQPK